MNQRSDMMKMNFPENYKNTVCCIKCRKLGIEYYNKKGFRYCKTCKSHVYIYNEIPVQKDPKGAKAYLACGVAVVFVMLAFEKSSPAALLFVPLAAGLFFAWTFKIEKNKIMKIETIMKEHLQNNFVLSKEDENIVEKEFNKWSDFENWKSDYLAGDPVRKFFSDEQIYETFEKQASKD